MTIELDAVNVTITAETGRFREEIAKTQSAMIELGDMANLPNQGLESVRDSLGETSDLIDRSVRETFSGLEDVVTRFVETGNLSFEGLRETALSVLNDIARTALQSLFPGGMQAGGGFFGALAGSLSGIGGRAGGGPVSPSRPYIVGERGPELFVPQGAGQILPSHKSPSSADRPISITVNVNGTADSGELRQSATQVALSVRRALDQAQRFS